MDIDCPRCGYVRQARDSAPASECPRCGIIYEKWRGQTVQPRVEPSRELTVDTGAESGPALLATRLLGALLFVRPQVNRWTFYGHAAVLAVLVLWGLKFIAMDMETNEIGSSPMHLVNLVFHEAGHILFMPFGTFMTILGGSLDQLLVPLVVMVAFLVKDGNAFGASVGLWWFGQSLMDLAPYINDARAQKLMLLGGVTGADMPGIHDWGNVLNALEIIRYDHAIARGADWGGTLLMLAAMAWGGYIVYREYRNIDPDYIAFEGEG
jgi:hypothetical protein